MFHHAKRSLVCSVYGDDVTTTGAKPDLDCFEAEFGARYELRKGGRIGPGEQGDKEGLLNKVVKWTTRGLEYEAGPRQIERPSESQGLDDSYKSTVILGLKPTKNSWRLRYPWVASC